MTTKKVVKKGFGISKETRGTGAIKFKLDPAINDGLHIGGLRAVTIGTAEYKDNQKGDFAAFGGKSVPTINFVFEGVPAPGSKQAPIYTHSYKPFPIVPGKYGWFYDGMFQTIKHFIDVLIDGDDNWLEAYDDLLVLEIDPEETMEFEDLVKAYTSFFEGIKKVFMGDGKNVPNIATVDGDMVPLWLKLLLYRDGNEVNNGNPGFSNYPGDGIIERYAEGVPANLRIAIEKGESIVPKAKASSAVAPPPTSTANPTANPANSGAPAGGGMPPFLQK